MADALPGAAAPISPADLANHHAHQDRDAVPDPLALLRLLDGWMSSSGMDAAHPWRIAIAATLAEQPAAPSIKAAPGRPARSAAAAAPFFRLQAAYTIAPGATTADLVRDGYALLSCARGVLSEIEIGTDALFAVLHLLQQAEAVIALADELTEFGKTGGAA